MKTDERQIINVPKIDYFKDDEGMKTIPTDVLDNLKHLLESKEGGYVLEGGSLQDAINFRIFAIRVKL